MASSHHHFCRNNVRCVNTFGSQAILDNRWIDSSRHHFAACFLDLRYSQVGQCIFSVCPGQYQEKYGNSQLVHNIHSAIISFDPMRCFPSNTLTKIAGSCSKYLLLPIHSRRLSSCDRCSPMNPMGMGTEPTRWHSPRYFGSCTFWRQAHTDRHVKSEAWTQAGPTTPLPQRTSLRSEGSTVCVR